MTTDATRQALLDAIRKHYERTQQPLLLAQLGAKVAPDLPEGMSLKEFIQQHLSHEIFLEADTSQPTVFAVATAAVRDAVRAALASVDHDDELARLPRSLLLAFCKKLGDDDRMFFARNPPYRFHVGAAAPNEGYVEIDKDLRLTDIYVPNNVAQLTGAERGKLLETIKTWASRHGIELPNKRQPSLPSVKPATPGQSALHRLLQAQTTEVRRLLLIPGDIADLLMRHE